MTTTNGSTTSASRTLVLACDVCEKPVTGKTGYICVDKDAAFEVRRRVDENQKELNARYPGRVALIPANEILAVARARWHIYHRRCDPQPDARNDYSFCISRVRTERDLLSRTAHLLEKRWLRDTDWSSFLYRVLNANGGPS
jgi:hypothetical protein